MLINTRMRSNSEQNTNKEQEKGGKKKEKGGECGGGGGRRGRKHEKENKGTTTTAAKQKRRRKKKKNKQALRMPTSWQRTIVSGCDRLLCHPDLRLWTKNFSGNRTIGKVSQTGKRRKRRISTADSTNCSVERPRFWNGPKHAIQTVKWLNTQKQATIPFHPNKTQANGQKLLTVRKKQREAKEKARAESSARSVATQNPKTKKEVRTRRDVSGKEAKGGGERREGERRGGFVW